MKFAIPAIALISGAALTVQVGMNNALRTRMGNPLVAAFVSFLTGTTALLIYLVVTRPSLPDRSAFSRGPWWIWAGGLVGACYVASAAAFASRLGAAPWLGLIVTGQIVASVAMDHFGLFGFTQHTLGPERLLGVALLLAGVTLVLRS
ncbi:MAG: hypothetical protein JWN86_2133 [Planctomycetota bacterium]|nr:hypothetical protein [Planctomycetota bacterium]